MSVRVRDCFSGQDRLYLCSRKWMPQVQAFLYSLTTVWPMRRRFKSWSNANSGFRIRIAIGMDRAVVTTALRARVLFMSPSSGQSIASLYDCCTIAMWRIACRGRVDGWPPLQRQSIRMLTMISTRIPTRIPRHPYWSIIGAFAVLLAPEWVYSGNVTAFHHSTIAPAPSTRPRWMHRTIKSWWIFPNSWASKAYWIDHCSARTCLPPRMLTIRASHRQSPTLCKVPTKV
jgi:hypothetical protein